MTRFVALSMCLLVNVAHAQTAPASSPGVQLTQPDPYDRAAWSGLLHPNRPLRRSVGIGLLVGSAAFLTLAITFVGLAKHANDSILADDRYHPDEKTRRDDFEITHTVFFTAAGVTFVPGIVLLVDK